MGLGTSSFFFSFPFSFYFFLFSFLLLLRLLNMREANLSTFFILALYPQLRDKFTPLTAVTC